MILVEVPAIRPAEKHLADANAAYRRTQWWPPFPPGLGARISRYRKGKCATWCWRSQAPANSGSLDNFAQDTHDLIAAKRGLAHRHAEQLESFGAGLFEFFLHGGGFCRRQQFVLAARGGLFRIAL